MQACGDPACSINRWLNDNLFDKQAVYYFRTKVKKFGRIAKDYSAPKQKWLPKRFGFMSNPLAMPYNPRNRRTHQYKTGSEQRNANTPFVGRSLADGAAL